MRFVTGFGMIPSGALISERLRAFAIHSNVSRVIYSSTFQTRRKATSNERRCAQSQTRPIIRVHARLTAQTTRQALQNLNTTQRESIATFAPLRRLGRREIHPLPKVRGLFRNW